MTGFAKLALSVQKVRAAIRKKSNKEAKREK
jgi:hypothetical protein